MKSTKYTSYLYLAILGIILASIGIYRGYNKKSGSYVLSMIGGGLIGVFGTQYYYSIREENK